MKKIGIITLLALLVLTGCGDKYGESHTTKTGDARAYTTLVEDHLYYIFHEMDAPDFPIYFEKFVHENPHLQVIDIEQDSNEQTNNRISGYFILTKLKEPIETQKN